MKKFEVRLYAHGVKMTFGVLFIVATSTLLGCSRPSTNDASHSSPSLSAIQNTDWSTPSGHIFKDIVLYKGSGVNDPAKTKYGSILGGNDNHKFPDGSTEQGVKVHRVDGSDEWLKRSFLKKDDCGLFVRRDDAALGAYAWETITE